MLIQGHVRAVQIEVIHRNQHRAHAQHAQVNLEPVGRGGFAAAGGAGQKDGARVHAQDILGNFGQRFIVQGLVYADELAQLAIGNQVVQIRRVAAPQNLAPVVGFKEGGHVLGPGNIGCGASGIAGRGHLQDESRRIIPHSEHWHIARARQHGAVKILSQAAALINIEVIVGTVGQQRRLIHPAELGKIINGLLARPAAALEGQVGGHDLAHGIFDQFGVALHHAAAVQLQIHAKADGVLDAHAHIGIAAAHGQQKDKTQRALIDAAAFLILKGDGAQRGILGQAAT